MTDSIETEVQSSPTLISSGNGTLRDAFGDAILGLAGENPRVLILDGDVAGGTGAHKVRTSLPQQFIQCGIAEQNMIGVAAGLAEAGFLPFVCTFASFMLRGLDQIKLAVAQNSLPVTLVASHPGLDTGPDGASAQCLDDFAVFRAIPGMRVYSPGSPYEVHSIVASVTNLGHPTYMRTGRSNHLFRENLEVPFRLGQPRLLREGKDVTIAATGVQVTRCLAAAEILARSGIFASVFSVHSLKPLEHTEIFANASKTGLLLSSEDHSVIGGLGSALAEKYAQSGSGFRMLINGVEDTFGQSGESDELAEHYGISPNRIARLLTTSLRDKP